MVSAECEDLEDVVQEKCRKSAMLLGADVGQMCWGALQTLDHLILREVKRQQLRISIIETSAREVDVLLLGLNATEGDELRHLASSRHEGVSAVAELVVEQTARARRTGGIGD